MKFYISGSAAISSQHTFEKNLGYSEWIDQPGEWLQALQPNYRKYVDAALSRRMSRIVKMSIATSAEAMREAGVTMPDSMVVGTGLGCMTDTEKFLKEIVESSEGIMSPTAFIQSTHNTVAGQIALIIKCNGYNFTYTNRGHSFENALQDAMLQLTEGQKHILVGGAEEMTGMVFRTYLEMECAGSGADDDRKPVLGEGASFFMLSESPGTSGVAIERVRIFNGVKPGEIRERIAGFLAESGVEASNVDAVVLGYNRDMGDPFYVEASKVFAPEVALLQFKNASGEYFTASAFGLFLATRTLEKQEVPKWSLISGQPKRKMNFVLIYNHYKGQNHSLLLLSRNP